MLMHIPQVLSPEQVRAMRAAIDAADWVDGRVTASPTKAKLWGAWQKIRGQGDDGAIVVLYTPASQRADTHAADAVLQAFIRDQGAALLSSLRATQSRQ